MTTEFQEFRRFQELLFGCVGGMVGTGICYPIDTIKTRIQNQAGKKYKIQDLMRGQLYKGMLSPMGGVMLEKACVFWGYDYLKGNGFTAFQSGILSGIGTTMVVTPFELTKVKSQTMRTSTVETVKHIIKNDGVAAFGRGWSATLFREVPGYGVYFWGYDYLTKNIQSKPLIGFLVGTASWIVIYPSDPIKTVMQSKNMGFIHATKRIYKTGGIRAFYAGYLWGVLRGGIFHSGVITGYEYTKSILKSNL